MILNPNLLLALAADCDAKLIRLIPSGNGSLTIDAPRGAMTPEFLERLKFNKDKVVALLRRAQAIELESTSNATATAAVIDSETQWKAVCRCGSTKWRDVPIHDGQSVRRECGRCERFLSWPLWYGRSSSITAEHTAHATIVSGPDRGMGSASCPGFIQRD
jgi:hypothetical protein